MEETLRYSKLKKLSDEAFRRRTGIQHSTFIEMVKILKSAERKKLALGGKKPKQAMADRLLMALELLGQKEKAQKVRWQAFEKSMDERFYVEYADNVHTDERDTIRKKASEAAFCQLNPYRAMKFLTWLRDAPALKTLVLNHRNILDGNHYRELTPAADFLSPEEPETAALLYRLMVQRVLDRGSSQHYVYAARNLRKAESCSRNFREEQTTVPGHSDFLRDLKAKHGRKYRFWEQVEKIAINA